MQLRDTPEHEYSGIDPSVRLHPTAQIAQDVYVGPHVSIGPNSQIGAGCRIHAGVRVMDGCRISESCELFPNAVLYPGTILGKRVTIHAGAVLGGYGFGYRTVAGRHERTSQLGWVEIADDVEIGCCTTIDRGTYGPTRIGIGTKLDNQVQIGHNVHLGQHNLLCAQVGIAGSSSTGDYVVLGGQVGVRDHVHLADHSSAAAQSGIARNLEPRESIMGTPALPIREAMQIWITSQRLPEMKKQLAELTATLAKLQQSIACDQSSRISNKAA